MTEDIKRLSEVFKVLAEPNRLRILLNLGLECRPVSAVIAATGLSQTNVSFHLRTLREAGLVRGEPQGPFVFYCLADPQLLTLLDAFRAWRCAPDVAAEVATGTDAGSPSSRRRS